MSFDPVRAALIRNWPPEQVTCYKKSLNRDDYGALYAVYADIVLSHAWTDVQIHALEADLRPMISGIQRDTDGGRRLVYPMRFEESTSLRVLDQIFQTTQRKIGPDERRIMLGIIHTDSTVVYYNLNQGIVKPTVN